MTLPSPSPETVPAVTVVIPTYNRAHLLSRALESVLAQTYGDFEALVVDDGSTDDTGDLVAGYETRDARTRYLVQSENAGVSAARNRGLREARGEYIAFLDSDDEWFPTKLERQVALFRELPERVGLVYTGVESVFGPGERKTDRPHWRGNLYRTLLFRNVIHGTSGVMLRREAIDRVGFFDEEIPAIEDYDYWLRVLQHFEADFVDEPLVRYHDPAGLARKSLNTQENLDAREYFYRKHGQAMRRAGKAHLFLLDSMHRHLAADPPDVVGAYRKTLRALAARPTARAPYASLAWLLRRSLLPDSLTS